jgi:hypothetical protein
VSTTLRGLGRYEILDEIGTGGMATVYLARQIDLGRLVALKELSAVAASDTLSARRFVRESRLAGSLNHPNIVTVHDFFEDHATPYIAMEYLERGSLRPLIDDLGFAQIAGVLEGLLAGLGYAHARGIVHRDVKPENLMLAADSRIKIADFGIAKATDELNPGTYLTATGTTIGTPRYMAPEQAMGERVGPWTDLYAVGMIAFELLSGRLPFDPTGTPAAILLRRVNVQPLRLEAVDPSADPRVSGWIDGLLATEPEQRPRGAEVAWAEFEEIVLDRLGSRWRHAAALDASATEPRTATTVRVADRTAVGGRAAATTRPRTRPRPAAPARTGGPARLFARGLLLLMALAVIAIGALSLAPSGGSGPASGRPAAAPSSAPAGGTRAQRRTTAPADGTRTQERTAPPATSGVGDSRSDDPSDDAPDGPEP